MAEQPLIDAFADCTERLRGGDSLEACLRDYPQLATELRGLVEAGQLVKRAEYSPTEVQAARQEVWEQIKRQQPFKARPRRWSSIQRSLPLVASLALVISALVVALTVIRPDSSPTITPASAPSEPTVEPTEVIPTATPVEPTEAIPTTTPAEPTDEPSPEPTDDSAPEPTQDTPTSASSDEAVDTTTDSTPAPPCTVDPPDDWIEYRVQSGDTLSDITSASGLTLEALMRVNCLTDEGLIIIGQELYLPRLPANDSQAGPDVEPADTNESSGHFDSPDEDDESSGSKPED